MTLSKAIKYAAKWLNATKWAIIAVLGTVVAGYIFGAIITIFGK